MNKPQSVRVLGQRFKVHYHPANGPLIEGDDEVLKVGNVAMGYCNAVTQELHIRDTDAAGFDAVRDTLLHESIHAILAVTGLAERKWLTDERAEELVAMVTPALLDMLRSNDRMTGWLLELE